MASQNALSGSAIGKSMQVNVDILGGIVYNDVNGSFSTLPLKATLSNANERKQYLSSSFGRTDTIFEALNHLKAAASGQQSSGPTGSIQLSDGSGGFTAVGLLKVSPDGDMQVPAELNVTGAVDMASNLTVDGASVLGATTGVQVSSAGVLTVNNATDASSKTAGAAIIDGGLAVALKAHVGTGLTVDAGGIEVSAGAVAIDDTTDASSKTTGALKVGGGLGVALKGHFGTGITTDSGGLTVTAGGIEVDAGAVNIDDTTDASSKTSGALKVGGGLGVALKGHFGTGLTVDSGGLTVSAGASEFGAGATFSGAVTASTDLSVGQSLVVTQAASVGTTLGVTGIATFGAGASFAGAVTASTDLSVGQNLLVTKGASITQTLGVGGIATFNAGASFAGAVTASTDLSVGQSLIVAGNSDLRANVSISKPGASNFSELPIFSIQGTTALGAVDDFRLIVSGGILRAVAI